MYKTVTTGDARRAPLTRANIAQPVTASAEPARIAERGVLSTTATSNPIAATERSINHCLLTSLLSAFRRGSPVASDTCTRETSEKSSRRDGAAGAYALTRSLTDKLRVGDRVRRRLRSVYESGSFAMSMIVCSVRVALDRRPCCAVAFTCFAPSKVLADSRERPELLSWQLPTE